jgi:flagellar hook-associated protein 2
LRSIRDQLLGSVTSGGSLATVGIQVDRYGRVVFDQTKFTAAYAADPTGTAAKFTGKLAFTDAGTSTGTASLSKASWRTLPGTYAVSATSAGGTIDGRPATGSGGLLFGAADTPVEGLAISYTGGISGTVTYSRGLAARIEALAQRASDATEGSISLAVKSHNSSIGRLRDDIDNWDTRLDVRRAALERQFSALEVSLGTLQNQGNWLAGQLSGLPKWS